MTILFLIVNIAAVALNLLAPDTNVGWLIANSFCAGILLESFIRDRDAA